MNKKGFNPFIASIILVGFTFILGASVFSFMNSEILKQQAYAQELISQPLYVKFSAQFSQAECTNEGIECGVKENGANCYSILVENQEAIAYNYYIWTEGERGVSVCGPVKLESTTSRIINVYFDDDKVGNPPSLNSRVIPAKL